MEKTKKMNNKGFSLVELIIVIAIMAILVGIVGSQVVPYIEKSRISKDLSTLDTVYSNFQTTLAEYSTKNALVDIDCKYSELGGTLTADTTLQAKFEALAGFNEADINKKFVSDASAETGTTGVAKEVHLHYDKATKEIAVTIGDLAVSSISGSSSDGLFAMK